MLVSRKTSKTFEPATEGTHLGVLCDVVALGAQDTPFGEREKVRLVWLLDEKDDEGHPKRAFATYTVSLHEKSRLFGAVRSITGRIPEEEPFDLDSLIGRVSQLVLEHTTANGKVYANIAAILKAPAGATFPIPPDFRRKAAKTEETEEVF